MQLSLQYYQQDMRRYVWILFHRCRTIILIFNRLTRLRLKSFECGKCVVKADDDFFIMIRMSRSNFCHKLTITFYIKQLWGDWCSTMFCPIWWKHREPSLRGETYADKYPSFRSHAKRPTKMRWKITHKCTGGLQAQRLPCEAWLVFFTTPDPLHQFPHKPVM